MTLNELFELLNSKTAEELFGDQGKDHPDYRTWARVCHPDINPDTDKAQEVFKLLETRAAESTKGIVITSKKGSYEIERTPFAVGDICDLYRGKGLKSERRMVKVTRNDRYIHLMQNEEKVLKAITPDWKEKPTLYATLPHIKDAFTLNVRNRPKRRVHVMTYNHDRVSLEQVHAAHPKLDPRSFAWIFKRLLLAIKVVHNGGYVHGAVMPQHFLVNKVSHEGKLIDFIHAVEIGQEVKVKTKLKDFYAPEILDGKPATPETDIYMAGQVAVYLLGGHLPSKSVPGTVPAKIRGFLSALLIEKQNARPDDAWELHQDFDEVLKRTFGPPKYVELTGV